MVFRGSRLLRILLPQAVVVILLSTPLLGQTTQLRGRVLDETNSVIPGASLKLTNQSTRMVRYQASDELGLYLFSQVSPAIFTVEAEFPGFTRFVLENLRLEVDSPLTLDITLRVGSIEESLTIVGSQPLLNKVDGTQGNTLQSEQISALPLNARNIAEALRLQPGVTLDGEVTGSRSDQIHLTLDGINVNDQSNGTRLGETFAPVLRVTPDSIQEFRMVTSNPNASQGRSSGAQVSFVTRSGSDTFHGTVYNYHRNTVTTANDFFNNRVGVERPALIRNVFGGSLGGPIVQERAFFFVNYEGRTDRKAKSVIRSVPYPHLGEGRMFYFGQQDQRIELNPDIIASLYPEVGGVNPAALKVFAEAARRYPVNDPNGGDLYHTGGFRFNSPRPEDWNTLTSRLDFSLSENHSLFIRGNYQWDLLNLGSHWPDTPSPAAWDHPTGLSVGHTWTLRPTLTNSLRYGLTRQAYSETGDSDEDWIGLGIFAPGYSRSRGFTSPVQNITNDTAWISGKHTFQFGTNIRLIEFNGFLTWDSYDWGGINMWNYRPGSLADPIRGTEFMYRGDQDWVYQTGISALLGRFTHYGFSYNFNADGSVRPAGSPRERTFRTQEYEFYIEDSWQILPRLTLNLGLRWGVNTPVYETTGFQVQPETNMSRYFAERSTAALQGRPHNELISIDRSGPYYDKPGYYETDWNNFAPRISFAYSPALQNGFLKKIFGEQGQSVLRGGFSLLYDRVGTAMALSFEAANSLGFSYYREKRGHDVTENPGPLFTGFDQKIRELEEGEEPELTFPRTAPILGPFEWVAEGSVDDSIRSPVNYSWNLSFGRELPGSMFLEISYIGRSARDLLATRDILQFNNLVDPESGMDWYTAAGLLYDHRYMETPIDQVPDIPFFENLFPDVPANWWGSTDPALSATQNIFAAVSRDGWNLQSYADLQWYLNDYGIHPYMFMHPQYSSMTAWGTFARSNYHALTAVLRKRFQASLTFDLNYTWSKSMDNASGLQDSGNYGAGFIMNALRPDDNYSVSDFDIQHIVNSNWLWELPFGQGKTWLNGLSGPSEALLGNWSLNGIFRWNSGFPHSGAWGMFTTSFMQSSSAVRTRELEAQPTKSGDFPSLWEDPDYAYLSYRNPRAGETGDRNVLRLSSYFTLDLGLHKAFRMPYSESHRLTFSWEVFNVTNTQALGRPGNLGIEEDPQFAERAFPGFGRIDNIQGHPRIMQFALRYDF